MGRDSYAVIFYGFEISDPKKAEEIVKKHTDASNEKNQLWNDACKKATAEGKELPYDMFQELPLISVRRLSRKRHKATRLSEGGNF